MEVSRAEIPDVLLLQPSVYPDERGFFFESYNRRSFAQATGMQVEFVQDNQAFSVRNVLRGLHYQIRQAQGKLIHVVAGEVFDVAVDLRRSSPTFGKWVGVTLSGGGHGMIWVPPGFAHGYVVLSEHAIVSYKTTTYYAPEHERCILWSDPALGIRWPLEGAPMVSDKDRRASGFGSAEVYG